MICIAFCVEMCRFRCLEEMWSRNILRHYVMDEMAKLDLSGTFMKSRVGGYMSGTSVVSTKWCTVAP